MIEGMELPKQLPGCDEVTVAEDMEIVNEQLQSMEVGINIVTENDEHEERTERQQSKAGNTDEKSFPQKVKVLC